MRRRPYTTVWKTARALHLSPQYVRRLISTGALSARKTSGRQSSALIIDRAELDAFLVSLSIGKEDESEQE